LIRALGGEKAIEMTTPTTEIHDNYITVTESSEFSVEQMFALIGFVKAEAERTGKERVLLDTRGMIGSMTEADRFVGGAKMAEVFGPHLRVAILMPPTQITKLGEIAAVNRGARVFVTENEQEALRWLLA
jgi:hypothetical protein